ncbi:hypothetical protein [Glaciibacter superstes]|uniref:hypothetical protein n=1 Tax=Glaciibacter superstes TaxID=501023 RepID=UPI0003B2E72F|nr:hypothetical protein [Glaciibacter superstes]
MERSVYFDGWSPQTYCQHPSMPPRRLSMIDDLDEMGATMLVWAGLGGGSISLPYLEEEAYGAIPARFRHYGYVNDSEFISHSRARSIDLFAIVFESQAWEFPAEIVGGEVVAQNELRGVAPKSTVGLREFSSDTGPASWKSFRSYFPDGLTNSDGDDVVDLWEEVACRDLEGAPIHAHWVEVAVRDQDCYYADRNNPVWREYLKAVIRTQIDAGARGIQLDETDTPMSALRYGGCFCKDCVLEFRSYLLALAPNDLPEELAGVDLTTFDYRAWLLERGHKARENPRALPLYKHFSRSLQIAIARTFEELARFAKDYAASRGVQIRVGGNFYDLAPYWDPMVSHVDVLVTEMRETRFQQPWYFRHGVGLSRGKPLVAVENPYGGVTPLLLAKLQEGRARDLFRLTIFEASAMGANMSLPYGSWLGTEIKDSYWVPRDLVVETGQFLKQIDPLISNVSPHLTAVIFSVHSLIDNAIDSDQFADGDRWFPIVTQPDARPASYWESIESLSRSTRTFDVVVFPDEILRENDSVAQSLDRYDTVVLPDVWGVSSSQHAQLLEYLDRGGRIVVHGHYGTELANGEAERLLTHEGTTVIRSVDELPAEVPVDVIADLGELAAVSLHEIEDGVALHIVNYDYDEAQDRVRVRNNVNLGVSSQKRVTRATVHAPGRATVELPVTEISEGRWHVIVPEIASYAVVHLH